MFCKSACLYISQKVPLPFFIACDTVYNSTHTVIIQVSVALNFVKGSFPAVIKVSNKTISQTVKFHL